jgi:CBS domain-containing protein/sporulation protein YlmC with PRC-barrel domain
MAYISTLIGRPVVDVDCVPVGSLEDIIAANRGDMTHPQITAIVVRAGKQQTIIPMDQVAVLLAPSIPLSKRRADVTPYAVAEQDLYLARDVLDKQIIDTDGVRVVRVNDLEIARVNNHFYVANVDIGRLGLIRRLWSGLADWMERRSGKPTPGGTISWENVELLQGDQPMRLKVSGDKISELHPADLAEIISDLTRPESDKLLGTLDVSTVADTLEEVEPDFQARLLESMPDEKVADVLEEMAPDEAADLLAEFSQDRSKELLNLMEREDADDVRKLLTYPIDTAGGLMNTEFVAVQPALSAAETIASLRTTATEAETIYYVYVTEPNGKLVGVFSLRELVMAEPATPIRDFMHKRLVAVKLDDSQEDVAQAVSKYNLLAVPVVDGDGRIQGIVTADDALDKIIPTAWKKKLPRLYH